MASGNSPFRPSPPYYQPPTVVVVQQPGPPPSQIVPALLNFFCLPGLGQLVQGRLGSALAWYVLSIIAAASVAVAIGIVAYPLVVILSVVDAARFNPTLYSGQRTSPVVAILGGVVMVIGMALVAFVLLAVVGAYFQHAQASSHVNY